MSTLSTFNQKQPRYVEWVRKLMFIYGVISMVLLAVMVILLGLVNCQPGTSYCNPSLKGWSPWLIAGGGLFLLKFAWDLSSRKRRSRRVKQYALFKTTTVSGVDDVVGIGQFACAATIGLTVMHLVWKGLGVSDSVGAVIGVLAMVSVLAFFPKWTGVSVSPVYFGGGLFVKRVATRLGGNIKRQIVAMILFGVASYLLLRLMGVE